MPSLKIFWTLLATSLFFQFSPCFAHEVQVDDLADQTLGKFPSTWNTYPLQKGKAEQVYKVYEENAKKYIHADDHQDISMPIFREFVWPLNKYPLLKWQWRALTLPKGAHEDGSTTNDSACSVYVAFGKTSGVALKYVWSSTLPVGHVWEKEKGKFYIIVKASGTSGLHSWKSEKTDVLTDYRKYFGKDPWRPPSGIGILTDGNATHSPSACDYSDFSISSDLGPAQK